MSVGSEITKGFRRHHNESPYFYDEQEKVFK